MSNAITDGVCTAFDGFLVKDIKALIRKAERAKGVSRWALYIQRGPKRNVTLRDGVEIEERFMYSGPVEPYAGFLFIRMDTEIKDEREQLLRDEVEKIGTHNIAVRYAMSDDSVVDRAIRVVLRE